MPDEDESWVMIAAVAKPDDASEVVYALGLRSLRARTTRVAGGALVRRGIAIEVHPQDEQRAREALKYIWDGMLGTSRAMTGDGHCPFCGYDVSAVPGNRPCPECGVDLNSVDARLRARDGGRWRTP